MKSVITVTVPFIPAIGIDNVKIIPDTDTFSKTIEFHKKTYRLKEVEGSRLVWFDNSGWEELGFNAIYKLEID